MRERDPLEALLAFVPKHSLRAATREAVVLLVDELANLPCEFYAPAFACIRKGYANPCPRCARLRYWRARREQITVKP